MSEELRDLLQQAVPEAPEIRADGVPARAALVRRRQVVGSGAALVLAAAAVVGGLALRGGDDGSPELAEDLPTTPSGSTAPYDVPLCRARPPERGETATAVPELDGVVAVRLCPDLLPGVGPRGGVLDPDEVDRLADLDAIVGDLDGFERALAALPAYDERRCANLDYFDDRSALMFVHEDGTTERVITSFCGPVRTSDGLVDGEGLGTAFLSALDEQRDADDYVRPYSGELTCDTRSFATPARPGRERLALAIACDPADELVTTLDADRLAALQAAWDDPQPVSEDLTPDDESDCLDLDDAPAYLKLATDHSDVVRLFRSPCGYLVWDGWEPGQNAAIPITLEELGLR